MTLKGCEDFHRTVHSERDRVPGLSRRTFLQLGAAAGLTLYGARSLPLAQALDAAGEAHAQAPDAPILVAVFLPGGLDLLDAFVPLHDYGPYRDFRGALAQNEVTTPKLGSTGLGIHPSLTKGDGEGIKGLFDRGRIGLLPGIDYANPDLSHFHSRAFWETGLITASSTTGWLGRWLDGNGGRDNPFQGVTSGYALSPVLQSGGAPVCSIEGVRSAELHGDARVLAALGELAAAQPKESEGAEAVRRSTRFALEVAAKLRPFRDAAPAQQTEGGITLPGVGPSAPEGYPSGSGFADRLRNLAFLLGQPLGVRVATVNADSDFDTHHGQAASLQRDLEEVSRSLAAFQADIEARGLGDRVLTFVWSEFGRRPKANGSAGTDHGAGGIGWVQGVRARSGVLTEYPSLRDLDNRQNLKVTIDFRTVYASLVEQWLGTAADPVIPGSAAYGRVTLVG